VIQEMHHIRPLAGSGDRGLAEIAARQHGVVARWQLNALGLRDGAVARRLGSGRLHRLHRGVYAVGHKVVPHRGRLIAAVLACGPDAVLSHRSAAGIWGILRTSSPVVEVTAPTRAGHPGITLHRVRRLDPEDRALHDGIPVTTVARTILDCAAELGPRRTEQMIEASERLRLFDLTAIGDCRARSRGHRGERPLKAALAAIHRPPADTRSPLEERFLDFCRDAGVPPPATNVTVAGYEVDAAWLEQRLVVELDSYEFHGPRGAFERDRVRDTAIQLAEFRVVRVTHRRLTVRRAALEAEIRGFLRL
jgi:hypothetical protein